MYRSVSFVSLDVICNELMMVLDKVVCISLLMGLCISTVPSTLLMLSATVIVRAGGCV